VVTIQPRAQAPSPQVGGPYQYRQKRKALAKALWTANFMMRLALNKVLPWLIAKPVFANLTYSAHYQEVLQAGDRTTSALVVLAALLVAALAWALKGALF